MKNYRIIIERMKDGMFSYRFKFRQWWRTDYKPKQLIGSGTTCHYVRRHFKTEQEAEAHAIKTIISAAFIIKNKRKAGPVYEAPPFKHHGTKTDPVSTWNQRMDALGAERGNLEDLKDLL